MTKTSPLRWVSHTILLLAALFFLWPFYWMVSGSFKNLRVSMQIPPEWFPKTPSFLNYTHIFKEYPIMRWFGNSLLVTLATTFLVLLCSSLAGYALSKINFKSSKPVFVMIVAAMSLPHAVLFIPLYQILIDFKLINSYWGVILPAVAWPFGVFLIKQFIQTLPTALIESGRIDGCNEFSIYWRIIVPLALPGLAVLAIFTFVSTWNDYVWQLIVLTKKELFTLPLGIKIAQVTIENEMNYGIAMAGAVIATIPVLAVFIYFQKHFTQGITIGAMKG